MKNGKNFAAIEKLFGAENALQKSWEEYLSFEHAVRWIAFGSYSWPGARPITLASVFDDPKKLRDYEDDEANQARYDFAFEQLETAVRNGRINLIGKHRDRSKDDLIPPTYIAPKEEYCLITENEIGGGIEGDTLNGYYVGDLELYFLIVPSSKLVEIF